MSGRSIVRVIAILALVGLVALIGVNIYNAGVAQGITQGADLVTASGAAVPVVVYPGYVGHPYGYGFGFFGFFGILFAIFGLFLLFGLIRAAFGWGRWGGHHGYGGPGGWKHSGGPREYLDDWHRQAHGEPGDRPGPDTA